MILHCAMRADIYHLYIACPAKLHAAHRPQHASPEQSTEGGQKKHSCMHNNTRDNCCNIKAVKATALSLSDTR